jgi:hypothetical protein
MYVQSGAVSNLYSGHVSETSLHEQTVDTTIIASEQVICRYFMLHFDVSL